MKCRPLNWYKWHEQNIGKTAENKGFWHIGCCRNPLFVFGAASGQHGNLGQSMEGRSLLTAPQRRLNTVVKWSDRPRGHFDRPTCPIWTQWSLCKKHVDICRNTVLLACVPQFDTMHPSMSLGANFNDRNFKHLSGNYPQVYGNIATTKLIQWKTAEMRGNKPFHGFCGFIFFAFFYCGGYFALKICASF